MTTMRLGARFVPALLLVLAAVLARGAGVAVVDRDPLEAVYAERMDLPLSLVVASTTLGVFVPTPGDAATGTVVTPPCEASPSLPTGGPAPALPTGGAAACPAELSEAMAPAWSTLAAGNWSYAVLVQESAPSAVAAGAKFVVTLRVDGAPRGSPVYVQQSVADDHAIEGARVLFDLGRAAPPAPQFVVTVADARPPPWTYSLRVVNNATTLGYDWVGVGGDIDGRVDPTLTAVAGVPMHVHLEYDDKSGSTHDFVVMNETTHKRVSPVSDDIDASHTEADFTWTPDAADSYHYQCKYHGASQGGMLNVLNG